MFENVRGVLKIIAGEVQFLHSLSLKSSQLLDLLVMLLMYFFLALCIFGPLHMYDS